MSKTLSIAGLMLKEAARDRSVWIQMIIVPVLLTTIMGFALGGAGGEQSRVKL
ncbi:MAG: hypothetical protein HY779_04780, partial [Rubrobacteridae bacterium]|nr:hypothetical protein [Rubrobacteridae bacterium]